MARDRLSSDALELTQRLAAFYERHGMSRRDFVRILSTGVAAAAAAPFIQACAPQATPRPEEEAPKEPAARPTSAPVVQSTPVPAAPAEAALLVYASLSDISNIDPHIGTGLSNNETLRSLYDSLLDFRGNPPELVPNLVREWSATPDGQEWTLNLAPNAKFHDGSAVTAQDVVYSFQRLLRKKKGSAWMFQTIMDEESIEAVDDHTVKIRLTQPYAPFEATLPWLFVVNQKLVAANEQAGDEGEAWLTQNEAGSGPFTIKRWEPGNLYEFEAVPDYWGGWPSEGRLSGYIWRITRESSSMRLALLSGEAHIAQPLSNDDVQALRNEPDVIINDDLSSLTYIIKINNQRDPTADVHVRRAIAYAMDYEGFVKSQANRHILAKGYLLPNFEPWYNPDAWIYNTDLDKAKQELSESEHPEGGFELEFAYVTGLNFEEQTGLILLDQLSGLNIKVKLTPMTFPDMVGRMTDASTAPHLMAIATDAAYPDPDAVLWAAYHSSQAGKTYAAASHYQNPEVDRLLEEGRATTDPARRKEIYDQVQEKLAQDCPEIPLTNIVWNAVRRKNVGGWIYTPITGGVYLKRLYLTKA